MHTRTQRQPRARHIHKHTVCTVWQFSNDAIFRVLQNHTEFAFGQHQNVSKHTHSQTNGNSAYFRYVICVRAAHCTLHTVRI